MRAWQTLVGTAVTSIACGGLALAQEDDAVFLNATYLGAPTDWCPEDAGVPVVIKMDGPDVVATPEDWPRTVKVRRGGRTSGVVVSEENTISLQRRRDVVDVDVIGRFSAELQGCQTPWSGLTVSGTWRFDTSDGTEAGAIEDRYIDYVGSRWAPFFDIASSGSKATYAKFGDRTFFTAERPNVMTTQTFAAKADKEQSK